MFDCQDVVNKQYISLKFHVYLVLYKIIAILSVVIENEVFAIKSDNRWF